MIYIRINNIGIFFSRRKEQRLVIGFPKVKSPAIDHISSPYRLTAGIHTKILRDLQRYSF